MLYSHKTILFIPLILNVFLVSLVIQLKVDISTETRKNRLSIKEVTVILFHVGNHTWLGDIHVQNSL